MSLPIVTAFLDAGSPLLLVLFGGIALLVVVIVSIIIIIIEAAMLWKWFSYGSFRNSFTVSLVMNITSTIAGVILAIVVSVVDLSTILVFLIAWLITIAIEAGVLMLMKQQAAKTQIWLMSLTVNTISYLLLFVVVLLFNRPAFFS